MESDLNKTVLLDHALEALFVFVANSAESLHVVDPHSRAEHQLQHVFDLLGLLSFQVVKNFVHSFEEQAQVVEHCLFENCDVGYF